MNDFAQVFLYNNNSLFYNKNLIFNSVIKHSKRAYSFSQHKQFSSFSSIQDLRTKNKKVILFL